MKKLMLFILSSVMVLSLCACGGGSKEDTSTKTNKTSIVDEEKLTPTIEAITDGIKNEFNDPDSVRISDASWARVKDGDKESKTEAYIICTVHSKNRSGKDVEQAYVIHCKNDNYTIVEEYNDKSINEQKKFNELGCGNSKRLRKTIKSGL